jgi:ABC-type glycerol-3-phosphate transport system substrate-binding protein
LNGKKKEVKMRRERFLGGMVLGLLAASMLVSLSGCVPAPPPVVPAEEEVVEEVKPVVVIIRTGPEADGLREVAKFFTEQTGIEVILSEVGREGYFTIMPTHMAAGTPDIDLAFFPSTMVAEFAEAGHIEPLGQFIDDPELTDPEKFDLGDFLAVYDYKGQIYALPTDVSTGFLYYRSDLIQVPPQTWEEYLELGKQFTRALNPDSPTTYGIGFSGKPPEELPKMWYQLMWSMGGELIDEEGRVGVNNEGAVKAGEFYRRAVEEGVVTPEIHTWSFPEVLDALKTGYIAMAHHWNAAYALIVTSDSPYRDKIKVTMVPGVRQEDGTILRTPFQHGWTLVMNSASENKVNAWKFLAYATGTEGGKVYAKSAGGTPARESLLSDPELQEVRPEYQLMLESLAVARAEPAVVFYARMHEAMNVALTKILALEADPETALDEAAAKIEELIKMYE